MIKTIFNKSDFLLCFVPVPKGYPQSQTHCSAYNHGNFVYLSTSPYPARMSRTKVLLRAALRKLTFKLLCNENRAEYYENPCIYRAEVKNTIYPTKFKLMKSTPLMDTPDDCYGLHAFNSDPELLVDKDDIYVLNRSTYRKSCGYINRLYLIRGKDEGGWFKMLSNTLVVDEQRILISPCIRRFNDKYVMTYLDTNSYNDGKTFNGLYMTKFSNFDEISNACEWTKVEVVSADYLPWHMSLFVYSNKLYSIVACVKKGEMKRCYQMLGEFSVDLSKLTIYDIPLTDLKSYRGGGFVTANGKFILYTTTVDENIKGGISVDGREIVVSSADFFDVLSRAKNR